MATDFVFPEDSGTGATGGDNADAANFATLAYATGIADKVVEGLTFTVDYTVPEVTVSAGLAVVTDTSAQEAQTAETRDQGVAYAVISSQKTVSLTDGVLNNMYLGVDLSTDDDVLIANADTAEMEASIKIGEIDTSADTKELWNRVRTPVSVYASESDVPRLDEGQFVWVQDDERYYYEDGN